MKRRVAAFLGLIIMVGVLLAPTLHRAHCAVDHVSHNAGQCPVCQIANTPVIAAAPLIEPVVQVLVSVRIDLPQSLTPSATTSRTAQARGPPAT